MPNYGRFAMGILQTPRLDLVPITLPMLEAVLEGRREDAEALVAARFPEEWPGRELVERAFACPIGRLRDDPASFLWGGRLFVTRAPDRVVVGSVILNGEPDSTGTVEVGYGVDRASQGMGYATEGTAAVVAWALGQERVCRVTAATLPWHRASLRVIEKIGMQAVDTRPHELFGELIVFERRRFDAS